MGNDDFSGLARKRAAAEAAVAAEKERQAEEARKAREEQRDITRLKLEIISLVISGAALGVSLGAFVLSLIALLR